MLLDVLLADLKRQYEFAGQANRIPNILGLIKGFFNPRFLPVILYRISYYLYIHKLVIFARMFSALNFFLFSIEIAMRCNIGKGLYFPHPLGIVIGALTIGQNAVIYHGVTVGAQWMDIGYSPDKRPVVGDNIVFGAGSKILGGVIIGNNVVVGANAVVTKSVPDNVVVGGIPATVISKRCNTNET